MGSDINRIQSNDIDSLVAELRKLILFSRRAAMHTINTLQVATNFEIGRRIIEREQQGAERARYGAQLLKMLSKKMTKEFGRGFSLTNLKLMRQFYLLYYKQIGQTGSDQFRIDEKSQTVSDPLAKSETLSRKFVVIDQQSPFALSWSHYVFLIGIKNSDERCFYEVEATQQSWSLRELRRQFDSSLYERLALSRDIDGVKQLAQEGQVISHPQNMLKDPYVLEFLGLDEKSRYSESDLETAIIDKLEHFLLELGKGFLFEARQKRFTFEEEHFFVD